MKLNDNDDPKVTYNFVPCVGGCRTAARRYITNFTKRLGTLEVVYPAERNNN